MNISIDFIVMSTDTRDHQSDHGSWSLHSNKDDAISTFDALVDRGSAWGLFVFKRTHKDGKVTMKQIHPKS